MHLKIDGFYLGKVEEILRDIDGDDTFQQALRWNIRNDSANNLYTSR